MVGLPDIPYAVYAFHGSVGSGCYPTHVGFTVAYRLRGSPYTHLNTPHTHVPSGWLDPPGLADVVCVRGLPCQHERDALPNIGYTAICTPRCVTVRTYVAGPAFSPVYTPHPLHTLLLHYPPHVCPFAPRHLRLPTPRPHIYVTHPLDRLVCPRCHLRLFSLGYYLTFHAFPTHTVTVPFTFIYSG